MYGRIDTNLWYDPEFKNLSNEQQLAYIYTLCSPHGNRLGLYRLPASYMAEDMSWSTEEAQEAIKHLSKCGLIQYDWPTSMIYVEAYTTLNTLAVGKRRLAAISDIENLPKTHLLISLIRDTQEKYPELTTVIRAATDTANRRGVSSVRQGNLISNGFESDFKQEKDKELVKEKEQVKEIDKEQELEAKAKEHLKKLNKIADEILDHFQATAGKTFRHVEGNREHIRARINDGCSVDDLKAIIEHKTNEWMETKFEGKIRPITLFGRQSLFDGYLNAAVKWVVSGKPEQRERTVEDDLAAAVEWAEAE